MYMCNVNTDSHHRVLIIKIVHTIRIFRLRLLTRLQGWYALTLEVRKPFIRNGSNKSS